MRGARLLWGSVALGVLPAGVVSAQSSPEVIVTAEKRDQRAVDIPMSLNVVSPADIENRGARDFLDVLLSIPGVSYSATESGLTRYSIRGVSTSAASPTVGIYLDDISLLTIGTSFSGAADPMLIDMERIEVLKGPQGTLYGGSAMGGAINVNFRRPTFEWESRALLEIGDFNMYHVSASQNLPLSNTVAVRAAVD